MEVRADYKQTEMGVIPQEWKTLSVSDVSNRILDFRGRTPRKIGMDWGNGDIPALSAGNVKMGYIDFDEECYFGSEALYQRWMTNGHAKKGDICFTTEAPLGNVAQIPDSRKYILSQRTVLFQPNPILVFGEYLFQYFKSDYFQKILDENATGSTAKGIKRKRLEKLLVVCPPLHEQRAIATALSDVDALLAKLDQLIAKKRDLKQGAMQQLLTGQTRLPGFRRGWDVLNVGEISEVKTGPFGSTLHESDYVQDGIPIITVEHLGQFGITRQNLPLVSDEDYKRLRTYRLEIGDIVFSRVGSVDRNALICKEEEGWLFSGRLLRVRPDKNRVFPPYLSFQFHTEAFKTKVIAVAVGQTMASLNTKILRDLSVALPSIDEQIAIASVLSDMNKELVALESRRDKTRELKQGMMQELLIGRIRLV